MSDDIVNKYAQRLRQLVDEYCRQQIGADDYRAQRKAIFDGIDLELNGEAAGNDPPDDFF